MTNKTSKELIIQWFMTHDTAEDTYSEEMLNLLDKALRIIWDEGVERLKETLRQANNNM